jgi:3D (Asp-Asp-Asp) domain-containing protein/peptidoglycan hydrolase CwlO-like protein
VRRTLATCLAVAASASVAAAPPAHADNAADARAALQRAQSAESDALLQLFAADSAVSRARARADDLRGQEQEQADRVSDARREVRIGRDNLDVARADLSARVAAAYRAGTIDPIVILLSASSLGDALDGIDMVNRVSQRDASLVSNVEHGLAASQRAEQLLAAEQRQLAAATAAAEAEQTRLQGARDAKASLLTGLRASKQIAAQHLSAIEAAAEAARQKADAIDNAPPPSTASNGGGSGSSGNGGGGSSSPGGGSGSSGGGGSSSSGGGGGSSNPSPPPAPSPGPVSGGQTLTVVSTAYAIHGTTATGIRTRRGICATDPSVIPLGTQFDVPGYGHCVAADTGGAIKGNRIDVWVDTEAEALDWGFKTVTISIL